MEMSKEFEAEPTLTAAADPTRRALLRFVWRSPTAVSRDAAAAALGIPRATAAFHLDRLVEAGLLAVQFRRLTGRTGPGAGRPAKLYQRTGAELAVTIPERHYDLAGDLLSEAIEASARDGAPIGGAIRAVASERGREIGRAGAPLIAALASTGYEPVDEEGTTILTNCPFHRLATSHTDTICGLNVALVEGIADGAGEDPSRVRFHPDLPRCCVRIDPAESGSGHGQPTPPASSAR
jgi:predicted ArsR family transcriptional regulator